MTPNRRQSSEKRTRDSRVGPPARSPAQLDREIADVLSRRAAHRSHSTLTKGFALVPGFIVECVASELGHATQKGTSVILASRVRPSASFGEPRHYATLIDQASGRTIYRSAAKPTIEEATSLAETAAERRHLRIVGRV